MRVDLVFTDPPFSGAVPRRLLSGGTAQAVVDLFAGSGWFWMWGTSRAQNGGCRLIANENVYFQYLFLAIDVDDDAAAAEGVKGGVLTVPKECEAPFTPVLERENGGVLLE